jgi:hypothetical protein
MPTSSSLSSLRSDIKNSLSLIDILSQYASTTDDEREELASIGEALMTIATQIDNQDLQSRNPAISALVKELGSSASDLNKIHQQAVDLQNTLNIAQQLLTAFNNIATAVGGKSKTTAAKTTAAKTAAAKPATASASAASQSNQSAVPSASSSPTGARDASAQSTASSPPGTWAQISKPAPFNVSMMLLLADGSVLCQAKQLNEWWRLYPDIGGRYANGQWRQCGNSKNAPTYYASATLADGRAIYAGGEYDSTNTTAVDLCAAEMFDPMGGTNGTWSTISTPAGWTKIGDAPCCVLPDGTFLLGSIEGNPCAVYDAARSSWTPVGSMQNGTCDEETWTLLPDGSVITVDCFDPPKSERYIKGSWRNEGNTPVDLVENASNEIGPAVLLPNGQVWAVGATGNTALFIPNPEQAKVGTWRTGPTFPKDVNGNQLGAKDAPACLLPNGSVLCAVGPVNGTEADYLAPTTFFAFDPTKPNSSALTKLAMQPGNNDDAPYVGRLLLLPSAEVMFVNGTTDVWFYNSEGAPNPNWAPTIADVPNALAQGGSYTLKGTQLNGMSQACAYGDDAALATNFPLVYLRSATTGQVTYCPTSNHSTMAVATGKQPVTTHFTVPESIVPGTYRLVVVANGIASKEVSVTVAAARIALANVLRGEAALQPVGDIMAIPAEVPERVEAAPRGASGTLRGTGKAGWLAAALLLVCFAGNIHFAPTSPLDTWLVTLVVITVSLALFGLACGRWEATFIDNRNRMSLSKLQVILWTIAIFSALLSASCFNAGGQGDMAAIMGITIDPKLWGLLGIAVTTAIGQPLALSSKSYRVVSDPELDDTKQNLHAITGVPASNVQNDGHVLVKADQTDARWSDLIRGDDVGNADLIDFSKVQQLYFTLLTLLIFGLAVARELVAAATSHNAITALPVPDAGFLGLLAASGAGYLVYKGMSHSKDGP